MKSGVRGRMAHIYVSTCKGPPRKCLPASIRTEVYLVRRPRLVEMKQVRNFARRQLSLRQILVRNRNIYIKNLVGPGAGEAVGRLPMVSLSWDGPSGPRAAARRPEMPPLPRNTIGKSTTGFTGPKPDQLYVYIYIFRLHTFGLRTMVLMNA